MLTNYTFDFHGEIYYRLLLSAFILFKCFICYRKIKYNTNYNNKIINTDIF